MVDWGTSMMRIINLGKPITGPGYYPGPSPAYLPEQVAFHANGPGYYSCATPKVITYAVTGGNRRRQPHTVAYFNTEPEARNYIARRAHTVEDGYYAIVPTENE